MQNKIIVVSGAAGALGSVVADTLREAGATVIGLDTMPVKGEHIDAESADLSDWPTARGCFAGIIDRFGRIDGLVNIAGTFRWETLAEGDVETWDLLYRVNLRTALCASKAALTLSPRSGLVIVNVGALAAGRAMAGMGGYAASKSAVVRLTESLAEEWKDNGVRVNAVLPSIIDTPANRADMPDADHARWVAPQALADVIFFLLSDAARAVTGASLPVTGRV
jgi:NAD(P)-dependent dehydrogenase (short-subunit alcohol dehydrogenase family)